MMLGKKLMNLEMAFERFGLLVGNRGTCPKGYVLVDGKCVPDNRSYVESQTNRKIG